MGNFRYYYIEDEKSLGATKGTYIVNLPEEGWLVALIARIRGTNAATNSRFIHPHDVVTKLEVVADGGEVIKSKDGRLCKGLNFLDGITNVEDRISQAISIEQDETFWLLFGGHLEDQEWGLDLGKHTNPQFKFTWDSTLTSVENTTATVAWHATTYPYLTLICVFLEGAPGSPRGFVRTQYITYTPGAPATEEVEIPRGQPLRRIVLRNFYAASEEENVFDRVKLDINRGGYIPFNLRFKDLLHQQAALYGLARYSSRLYYTGGDSEDSHLSHYMAPVVIARSVPAYMFYVESRLGGRFRVRVEAVSGTNYASAIHLLAAIRGIGFHHCLALPFDKPGGLAAALPTRDLADIRLKISSNSSAQTSSTAYVLWEDIVGY